MAFKQEAEKIFLREKGPMTAHQFVCHLRNWPFKTVIKKTVIGTYTRHLDRMAKKGLLKRIEPKKPEDAAQYLLK